MLGEGVQQFQVFVVFAVLGFALCSVYLFSMGLFRSRLAIVIFDCIFGASSVYAVFAANLAVNNGEFRIFVFVALAIGSVLSVAICKTLLDKASSALYNLFTTKEDDYNAARVSQQKIVNTDNIGSSAGSDTDLHATGIPVADVVIQPQRRKASSANRRSNKPTSRAKRPSAIHANRRIRQALGRKQRQNVSGRHTVDS